jgi:uncharacterized protein
MLDTPTSEKKTTIEEEHSPLMVLLICIGLFVAFNVLSIGVMIAAAKLNGITMSGMEFLKRMSSGEVVSSRNFMRLTLLISHLFNFVLPGLLTYYIVYKKDYLRSLKMLTRPTWIQLGLAVVLLLVSIPLVQYVYVLNAKLPLPKWMMSMEDGNNAMIKFILTKEHWWDLVVNLLLIALMPAISEELMFRGVLQQQLGRIVKNPHVSILITAAIFSAVHLQFQGFFPRMLLGMLLGYLFFWTKSLWVSSMAHFTNNALTLVVFYAQGGDVNEVGKAEGGISLLAGLVSLILVLGIGWYMSRDFRLTIGD